MVVGRQSNPPANPIAPEPANREPGYAANRGTKNRAGSVAGPLMGQSEAAVYGLQLSPVARMDFTWND
jgi:hypothetical protein